GRSKFTGIRTGNGGTAHSDPIIVASQNHDFIARLWLPLHGLIGFSITDAPGLHDYLVEPYFTVLRTIALVMFKGKDRTGNEWLTKFVSKIRSSVGGFDQDVHWGLVQPRAFLHPLLPRPILFQSGVGGHINSGSRQGQGSLSPGQTVPDLSPRTGSGTVKRLNGSGEIMGFRL